MNQFEYSIDGQRGRKMAHDEVREWIKFAHVFAYNNGSWC